MSGARWPYPRILAHRGGGTLAPENTLAAIRHGHALGFRGIEVDAMLAGDGTPVLIHDETLERTTGAPGRVAELSHAALAARDAGAWAGARWRGERIPTLEAAAALCAELGTWMNVEIKPAAGHEVATGAAVARMMRAFAPRMAVAPLLSSFSLDALRAALQAAPELRRGYIVRQVPADWPAAMRGIEGFSLHCSRRFLDAAQAQAIHAAGYGLACWTVNDPQEAHSLLALGADCIITDRLDLIGPAFPD